MGIIENELINKNKKVNDTKQYFKQELIVIENPKQEL